MAGHNKWSKIKNKKGVADVKKGKMFTKVGRQITVAVKEGGENPEYNAALQSAIEDAKAINMPNKNIERAIKAASQNLDSANFEHVLYEGYGPEGIAIIVEGLTDNRNRTAPEIRHAFDKHEGNLGTDGSVVFMFDRLGVIQLGGENHNQEELMELALEANANDVVEEDGISEIFTSVEDFHQAKQVIKSKGYEIENSQIMYLPKMTNLVNDPEKKRLLDNLIETLEDNDDVQNVYHNWENDED
ncbi:YebC/PmpR family DNA-binding transcriptional regulator [Helcococcus massiliensis]|uniref:YebC/PmpR family DNA-binding transcriptional regulator n=1 Tax=Helcococcus massiliensis TaxID=2040290 RepID=UPI000CDE7B69|nr:YebC/PmpR family DNA-binding transcriptional regulator [Helcococcus massiliensis]